ncbi:MAG: hypothetical protein FXF47_05940 [Candidatus Mcinerneyibacterium aminivorans]|uniref:Uncharacterized protein n=1 Tax=Candidatus Mcinerneyibacterium aminivorans TaxID=2703815 RepID=A0A5D0MGS7_9BACT|nr:MAG: hypothetical protein FXF47_05940 [Candidatus Mcinerneyibacterium aminivorans]
MFKWIFERIIIELFIYYEKITRDIFLDIFISDAGFSKYEAKKYWDSFDTSSAVYIKAFIKFLKNFYNVNWYDYKKNMKEEEKKARKIRGDIIHAKKHYSLKKYFWSIRIILILIKRKKKYLYKPVKKKDIALNKNDLIKRLNLDD